MPVPGQVRIDPKGGVYVYAWAGRPPALGWISLPMHAPVSEVLRELGEGAVIDWKALPDVIILQTAPAPATVLDDATFEALLREAEQSV